MELVDFKGRSWIEVSLSTILTNLEIYRKSVPSYLQIMAVVKADAYGHGDSVVSKLLNENGINHFAVSNVDEAIRIRESGVDGQILILGYTPLNRLNDLVMYDITQTLLSEEYAKVIAQSMLPIKCQFAIDTGMRRIGLNADDLDYCESIIREYSKKLCLNGIFTHLCVADTEQQRQFTNDQIDLFEKVVQRVSDLNLPFCHCMNSAGGLWYTSEISCFARLGIILYGLKPDYSNKLPQGIEPALTWKSVVSMVKNVHTGDSIGYGRSYIVNQEMRVATVPTGYADGYSRLLSNKGWVLINGCKAPIIGRICMDQMMVDVTRIDNVSIGTEVILLGKSGEEIITADDLAHIYGSIGYEVVCAISKRVDRVFCE